MRCHAEQIREPPIRAIDSFRPGRSIMIDWNFIFKWRERPGKKRTSRTYHRTREGSTKAAPEENISSHEVSVEKDTKTCDTNELIQHTSQLGKSHLGRFARESEMPSWLAKKLAEGGQVCTDGVIPDLVWLAERSSSISYTYFCNPCVQHVSKLRHEGGFCGYRNIQCLISYIISMRSSGYETFGIELPSVFQIQDLIERAWEMGFNPHGRLETGGIRGTRKYIGTPEAQALFNSISVPCSVKACRDTKDGKPYQKLLKEIEAYFEQSTGTDKRTKIRATDLPPIYLQHQGHSLTVVGFAKDLEHRSCLYVLDPSMRDPQGIKKYRRSHPLGNDETKMESILEVYRRGEDYLSKHDNFELLL